MSDTSTKRAEEVAALFESAATTVSENPDAIEKGLYFMCVETAAMLRALGTERDALKAEIEKLQTLLESVLNACDQGWKVERSVGGMTVEGQMRRSFYNRVPAWPIEEARAAWGEKK